MVFLYIFLSLIVVLFALLALWAVAIRPGKSRADDILSARFFAHRGLHDSSVPENSLAAFRLAKENGFGSELDVHISNDGGLYIMHDENLTRMCGKNLLIGECTKSELDNLRLGDTDEKIPMLSDVLTLYGGAYPLIIELKSHKGNYAALTDAAVKELRQYKGAFCVESFDPRILLRLKKTAPEIIRGQLSERFSGKKTVSYFFLRLIIGNLLTNVFTKPDFIAYHIEDAESASLRLAKNLYNPALIYWTVHSEEQRAYAEKDGAAIIFERR